MIAGGWLLIAVHSAWQGALAAATMLGLSALLRRFPSRFREALLVVALIKFLVPPFIPAPTGVFSQTGDLVALPPVDLARDAVVASPQTSDWMVWLFCTQIAGTAAVIALAFGGWLRVRRWRRTGVPADTAIAGIAQSVGGRFRLSRIPEIVMSDSAPAPVAAGVLRPVVVLPARIVASLGRNQIEALLAHEFAHHSRHHLAIGWLRALACAAWWWHPLVWATSNALQRVQEEVCDDAVVAAGVMAREPYCDMLLRAASAARPRFAVMASFADRLHPLGRRLRRLLDGSPEIQLPKGTVAAAAAIAALLILPGISLPRAARESSDALVPPLRYAPYATAVLPDPPHIARAFRPAKQSSPYDAENLPIVGDVIKLGESADRAIDVLVTGIEHYLDPPPPAVAQIQTDLRDEVAARIAEPIVRSGAPLEVADRIARDATRGITRPTRNFWRTLGRGIGRSFGSLFSSSDSPSPSPSRSDSPSPSRSDSPSPSNRKP